MLDFVNKAKWDAWKSLGSVSQVTATSMSSVFYFQLKSKTKLKLLGPILDQLFMYYYRFKCVIIYTTNYFIDNVKNWVTLYCKVM